MSEESHQSSDAINVAKFSQAVDDLIAKGWRIESQTPSIAVLLRGHKPNHILHCILTIFTLGLWFLIWMNIWVWGGERRCTVRIKDGKVIEEKQRPGAYKDWPPKKRIL